MTTNQQNRLLETKPDSVGVCVIIFKNIRINEGYRNETGDYYWKKILWVKILGKKIKRPTSLPFCITGSLVALFLSSLPYWRIY